MTGNLRRGSSGSDRCVGGVQLSHAVADSGLGGVLVGLTIGVVFGAITDEAQSRLPWAATSIADSAGAWVLVCYLVALTGRSIGSATVRGLACMVGLAGGFYLDDAFQGFSSTARAADFWFIVAVVSGPMVGWAAGRARFGPRLRSAATGGIGGLLILDAILQGIAFSSQSSVSVWWFLQIVIGAAMMAGSLVVSLWKQGARIRLRRTGGSSGTPAHASDTGQR